MNISLQRLQVSPSGFLCLAFLRHSGLNHYLDHHSVTAQDLTFRRSFLKVAFTDSFRDTALPIQNLSLVPSFFRISVAEQKSCSLCSPSMPTLQRPLAAHGALFPWLAWESLILFHKFRNISENFSLTASLWSHSLFSGINYINPWFL